MCSKLYADGELAATPYETDKVLRHRWKLTTLSMSRRSLNKRLAMRGASNAD